jgi:hypothetical protein
MKQIYLFFAIFLYCSYGLLGQHPNVLINRGVDPRTGELALPVNALKSSGESFLTPSAGFEVVDLMPDYDTFSAFDVLGDRLYGNEGNTIVCLELSTGLLLSEIEKPEDYVGWPSFLNADPGGEFLWAGYTNNGNTDDRIYKIDLSSGEWSHVASSSGNFDMAFRDGMVVFTGLNSSDWEDPTSLFILDDSGENHHQKIIEIGGSSAGLAIDAAGNIYYGTYFYYSPDPNAIYRWSSTLVDDAIENNYVLTIADGDKLTDLPNGAYDCHVDDGGNLLFNINSFATDGMLAKWNGTAGDGLNYDILALATDAADWLTMIKSTGDINSHEAGNALFVLGYGRPVAKVRKAAPPSPFISEVLTYKPAPGQFINKTPWGTPASENSLVGGVQGSMSLGAFGGYVVFRFEESVKNHPDNPYGVDFTVFGNPLQTWSEPASVWVMKDENGNGVPDDTWYELAGSDYWFSTTRKNYAVSYTNPGGDEAKDVPWTDNLGNSGSVLANAFHKQPYYPLAEVFPSVDAESYSLSGTLIEGALDMRVPTYIMSYRRAFGYADNQPRGQAPWTVPDNPYVASVENAGGDGFDISWAVDTDGNYVDLDEIHFVKVVAAMQRNAGWLGEVSTEITGAVVVEPDASISGEMDMIVIKELPYTIESPTFQLEAFAFHMGRLQADKKLNWVANLSDAYVDEDQVLHLSPGSGALTLTASLADNPAVSATVSAEVNVISTALPASDWREKMSLYPNPVVDYFAISVVNQAELVVFNATGSLVLQVADYSSQQKVQVSQLQAGVYLVRVKSSGDTSTFRFVKQ